jgi:membrane protein YqaA with SNARE-associated domain
VAFIAVVLASAVLIAVSRERPELARVEILTLYFLYMSVACTFLPLPTAWIVLWAAREIDPISVALIGTVGTCIANMHDYYIVHSLLRLRRVKKARETTFYKQLVAWFHKAPFITLTAASFLPIPIDMVRILAVSAGYPRPQYALATFAGRLPRYLLLAYIGYELQPSNTVILIVLLATAVVGMTKVLSKLRDRRSNRTGALTERSM